MKHEDFSELSALIREHSIIHIAGSAGTGKSTLALQLIGSALKEDADQSCIWIQASKQFPKKRAEVMFKGYAHILDSFYVLPPKGKINNYPELVSALRIFSNPETMLPPGTSFMVVDNISHHLRYELGQRQQYTESSAVVNSFFNQILFPLIMLCKNNGFMLFLIHEVSYSPSEDKTKPFLSQLYERIEALDIMLTKVLGKKENHLQLDDTVWEYSLKYHGVSLLSRLEANI